MSQRSIVFFCVWPLAVAGCVSLPAGPSVMVLPGSGHTFEQFRNDDAVCQQYAYWQIGGTSANQAATNGAVTSAAVGTAVGAAAGAALGGGGGAAVGAGVGMAGGSIAGTGVASSSWQATQDRYDIAYIQCMYAKGHQVPVRGQFSPPVSQVPSPASVDIPPPPPGSPPPPPPTVK